MKERHKAEEFKLGENSLVVLHAYCAKVFDRVILDKLKQVKTLTVADLQPNHHNLLTAILIINFVMKLL